MFDVVKNRTQHASSFGVVEKHRKQKKRKKKEKGRKMKLFLRSEGCHRGSPGNYGGGGNKGCFARKNTIKDVVCINSPRYERTQWCPSAGVGSAGVTAAITACCELLITFPRITVRSIVSPSAADGGAYGCCIGGGCVVLMGRRWFCFVG
ncbi:hypothetical protein M0804_010616 [Polistes exclamans]|nr:hypothetical protein M0804_010616 [Polistes exclamans]